MPNKMYLILNGYNYVKGSISVFKHNYKSIIHKADNMSYDNICSIIFEIFQRNDKFKHFKI